MVIRWIFIHLFLYRIKRFILAVFCVVFVFWSCTRWDNLHNSQFCINTTLIHHESESCIQKSYFNIQNHYNTFKTNMLELLSKILELLCRKIELWYNFIQDEVDLVVIVFLKLLPLAIIFRTHQFLLTILLFVFFLPLWVLGLLFF